MKQVCLPDASQYRSLLVVVCLSLFVTAGLLSARAIGVAAGDGKHAEQSFNVAAFPFYDGFETGTLGADWTVSTTNQGRVVVSSTYAYSGTYSLLLDDALNDTTYSFAAAILTIDLSGQTQVELDFWWDEFGTDSVNDGVFISADSGANWYRILSFDDDPTTWRHQVIDLDAAAAAHGLTLNDHFQIKFQMYADDPIPLDGYAIDEVRVRAPQVPVPASFPYYAGFESGALGNEWVISFTNEGRIRVDPYHPYTGTYSLLLDDWENDTINSLAAAILTVDLSGQTQVELDFWWDEFGTDSVNDGVFISNDNGANWSRILSFDDAPTTWRHQVIDLDAAAAANGLTLNDHFQIKFQLYADDPIPLDGYAIDEVRVRAPQVPVPANFPYYNGFESGALGNEWLIGFTNEGRIRVDPYHPYTGTYSLLLDDWQSDTIWSTAAAILTIDLSGQTQVELDFWWDEYGTTDDVEDGVFISNDNGANWYRILSFDADPTTWRHQVIDLDAAAAANGLTLNDHFQIKFQFYDDDPIPTDGYAIDEVRVRAPQVPVPASFPYYNGFESGALGNEWLISFTNEGRARVDPYHPYTGTYSLLLDDWQSDAIWSTAAAILTVDLSGQTQVELDFWWDEYGTMDDVEDGVFISNDNGANWYRILSFDADPTTWRHQVIDLDAAAAANGLTLNDHFQVKFQFYDDDPIPTDGYAIDEVRVRAPHAPTPASFPYYNGFESGALGNEWLISFTNEGRIWVDSSHPYTGTYSLLLDDWQSDAIWSTAAAILTIDLSGQTQVELDFWWDEYGTMDDVEDGVFISADSGASWYRILSFDADPTAWRHQVIDLDAAAAANGLTLNDHFQIKFQFYDDDPIPTDGYAFDEVQVRPNAAPTLAWPGDANYQQDGLHPESGDVSDDYIYRIKYTDIDTDSPDFVRVHIQKGGVDIAGGPFAMACASGDYGLGVTCTFTKSGLDAGTDYAYYFVAQDDQGNPAAPTAPIDAPDVTITFRVYLPLIMKNAGPPAGAPILNAINNPGGNYKFIVSWSAVERATRYTLEEDDSAAFSSPATVYAGSSISTTVSVSAVGTYYYRVKASNSLGETSWSNIQSVIVTVPPPPCPQAGSWSGLTDEGYAISYTVADTPSCRVTTLEITVWMDCIIPSGSFLYTVEYGAAEPIVDREFEYYYIYDPNRHTERVSGTFTSQTQANGSSFFMIPNPANPYGMCVGGSAWTASYNP